jgi:hypothetical protein
MRRLHMKVGMKIHNIIVGVAVVGVALIAASVALADSSPGGSAPPTNAAALQAEVSHQLASTQGGVQAASNVVSYDNDTARVVFPLPGQTSAVDPMIAESAGSASPLFSTEGCPWGWSVKWSCFYTSTSFTGTMLEFKDCGYTQYFYPYTSADIWSWVNTKDYAKVEVFGVGGGSQFLWGEGTNAQNSNVGSYDASNAYEFYTTPA